MADKREEDRTQQEEELLNLLRKLTGSRGGDVNDFDQQYVEPTANENYGYVDKPGFMNFAGVLPGPIGMAAKATSGMINQGNNQAVRRAREAMGLPNEKPSFVRDVLKGPKDGKIADVNIADQKYSVGFEAKDAKGNTTLTPNEARMRGMANGGLTEDRVSKPQSMMDRLSKNVFGKQDDMDDGEKNLHAGMGLSYDTEGGKYQPLSGLHDTGRKLGGVEGMAIHHTGGRGSPEGVVDTLNNRGLGVQYVMDRDGTIYSTGPTDEREAHIRPAENGTGLSNDNTLGIEVIANDDSDLTPEQIQSGVGFINDQISRNPDIGLNVFGHGELNSHKQDTEGMSIVNAYRNWRDDALNRPAVPSPRPDDSMMIAEQPEKAPTESGLGFVDTAPSSKQNAVTVDPNRFKDITDDEKTLMGMTLAGEIDPSKTDLTTEGGRREAMGILSTVENRLGKYGSITDTITAPKQYSTWNNEAAANTAANNYHGNKSTYDTLVSDYISNPQNNLGFTSYHANYVNPGWSSAMQNPETIGPHTFGFLGEYSADTKPSVTPHTVFNTSASYAPNMTGMVSDVNANRGQTQSKSLQSIASSQPESKTQSSMNETRGTGSSSSGFSGGSGMGTGTGGSSSGTGSSSFSGMTGTSGNPGKDKDDKASSGFSGGRSY